MRKLMTKDIFALSRIVQKSKVKEELAPVIAMAAEKGVESLCDIGINGMLTIFGAIGEREAEIAIYKMLGNIAEIEAEEVENLGINDFLDLLKAIGDNPENDLKNFFKQLSNLITSKR